MDKKITQGSFPLYSIVVDYREPENWDNIAAPVIGTPVVDNKTGKITVPFTAMVGGIYADSLEVRMLNESDYWSHGSIWC